MASTALSMRQRRMVQALWRFGPQSRIQLHTQLGLRPNTVGADADRLVRLGILRESDGVVRGRGRPARPLRIDDRRRQVVGLALRRQRIEVARLSLTGQLVGQILGQEVAEPRDMVGVGAACLRACVDRNTLAVGISTPGFVESEAQRIVFSAIWPAHGPIPVQELYRASGARPVVLENDMHALAAQWLLSQRCEPREDALLVYIDDGQLGSALLVGGRPNRGCITGANELGHTRLPVATEGCYCGQTGCIERIVSSAFAGGGRPGLTLAQRLARGGDPKVDEIVGHLGMVLANAVNFTRVQQLVLAGPLGALPALAEPLTRLVRRLVLPTLAERITMDAWGQSVAAPGIVAGWLALTQILIDSWE